MGSTPDRWEHKPPFWQTNSDLKEFFRVFDSSGRLGRLQYNYTLALSMAGLFLLLLAVGVFDTGQREPRKGIILDIPVSFIGLLIIIMTIYICWVARTKRFHDQSLSGDGWTWLNDGKAQWARGDDGPNEYGERAGPAYYWQILRLVLGLPALYYFICKWLHFS